MPVNPRTPVLVGYGQLNHREDAAAEQNTKEPVDLMVTAARQAADARVLEAVDAIRVVNVFSARYRDPGLLLGQRIGADRPATRYSGVGGNVPQSLVNQACLDIRRTCTHCSSRRCGSAWGSRSRITASASATCGRASTPWPCTIPMPGFA